MADRQLARRADAYEMRRLPVDSAQVIELGDMVWLNGDDARPASAFSYVSGNLPGTQANFRQSFIGIAMGASESGETEPIPIATRGVFEMDVASATFEVGDLLGPDDNATPDALLDQQVIAIGENGYGGIMRVAERVGSAGTRVLAEILPSSVRHPDTILTIPLGVHAVAAAVDLVTDMPVQFPMKLVALNAIITTVLAAAGEDPDIAVHKGTTALDDVMTLTAESAVGAHFRTALDDATGDDRVIVGDTISLASDGDATSGAAFFFLEVRPFLMES